MIPHPKLLWGPSSLLSDKHRMSFQNLCMSTHTFQVSIYNYSRFKTFRTVAMLLFSILLKNLPIKNCMLLKSLSPENFVNLHWVVIIHIPQFTTRLPCQYYWHHSIKTDGSPMSRCVYKVLRRRTVPISHFLHVRYMHRPSHAPCFHHLNNIWGRVETMTLLILQSSSVSCHFAPLRSKYSPQHPVFKHLQSVFFP
jgi:hypothetical protein